MFLRLMCIIILLVCSCRTIPKTDELVCHRYVILPPHAINENTSDHLAQEWIRKNKPLLSECDSIVNFAQGKVIFSVLNIDFRSQFDKVVLGNQQIKRIMSSTKATRLVRLKTNINNQKLIIEPELFNLNPFSEIYNNNLATKFESDQQPIKVLTDKMPFKDRLIRMLPNAVNLNLLTPDDQNSFKTKSDYTIQSAHSRSIVPQVVSAIGFSEVVHPFGFNMFDISFEHYFGLYFKGIDLNIKFQKKDEQGNLLDENVDYDVQHYSMTNMANWDMNIYTVFGTTYFGTGVGIMSYIHRDSMKNNTNQATPALRLALGQRAFFSKRVFIEMGLVSNSTLKPIVENEVFSMSGTNHAFLGFGYFSPEMRKMFSR